MKSLILKIDGMKCDGCASRVGAALSDVAGVRRAKVSLDDSQAQVVGEESLKESDLVSAVEEAGYEARASA